MLTINRREAAGHLADRASEMAGSGAPEPRRLKPLTIDVMRKPSVMDSIRRGVSEKQQQDIHLMLTSPSPKRMQSHSRARAILLLSSNDSSTSMSQFQKLPAQRNLPSPPAAEINSA